ncbi:LOB domain-containing protein 22 [Abeliophyllum distichum]|uniref:LOB domain-containing protein 22 n=1 Tax=Abeliophyllum distichum TaxID=126358 RepID=A0ABD1RXS3_9LAMI
MHNNMSNNNNTIQQPRSHATTQACAACKYQRRKCAPDCILAPYFPHERHHQFLNAHKLFGVSNIIKIIRHLDQQSKDDAMRTIIFQSDVRACDPVGGCYRIIRSLERQINVAKAELEIVLHHLALCRAQAAAVQHQAALQAVNDIDSTLNCDVINGDPLGSYDESINNYHHHIQVQPPQQLGNDQYIDQEQIALQEINAWGTNVEESIYSSFPVNHRTVVDECDDIKPNLDLHDEREEFKFDPADENAEPSFVTLA